MQWMNLNTTLVRAAEYIGSEPTARATWFNLLAYCCEQENYGVILGGAKWKDRQWQQACGVTLEEVNSAAPLVTVDGGNIVVWGFPSKMLDKAKARRDAAAENGKKGGRPPKEKPKENPEKTQDKHTGFPACNPAETHEEPKITCKSKVREDKLREDNINQNAHDAQNIPPNPDEDLFGEDELEPDPPPPLPPSKRPCGQWVGELKLAGVRIIRDDRETIEALYRELDSDEDCQFAVKQVAEWLKKNNGPLWTSTFIDYIKEFAS